MFKAIYNLRILFDILSLFGVNLYSPARSSRTQLMWKIWILAVLLFQSFVLINTIIYRDFFLRSDLSPVGMLLNLVHYSWMMSSTVIVIALSLATEQEQLQYWTELEKLRELRLHEESLDTSFCKRLAWKAMFISLTLVSLNVSVLYLITYDQQWTKYVSVGISSILINRIFCVKVYLFLEGLSCEIQGFERYLQACVDRRKLREVHIRMAIDWHSSLSNTAKLCNRIFNWSLFAIFLDSFIQLVTVIYWAYMHMTCMKNMFAASSKYTINF